MSTNYRADENAKIVRSLHNLEGETIIKILDALQNDLTDHQALTDVMREIETYYLSTFMDQLEDGAGFVPGLEDLYYMDKDAYDGVMNEFRDTRWEYLLVDYQPYDTHADRVRESLRKGCRDFFGSHDDVIKFRKEKDILEQRLKDWGCQDLIAPTPPQSYLIGWRQHRVETLYREVMFACGDVDLLEPEPVTRKVIEDTMKRVLYDLGRGRPGQTQPEKPNFSMER